MSAHLCDVHSLCCGEDVVATLIMKDRDGKVIEFDGGLLKSIFVCADCVRFMIWEEGKEGGKISDEDINWVIEMIKTK